jgi:hypothetical protein
MSAVTYLRTDTIPVDQLTPYPGNAKRGDVGTILASLRKNGVHKRAPGLEDWHVRHVTLEEAVAAGRISPDWAEQRARQWGRDSALYANRVLGEFHASDEDSVIPLA